MDPLLRERHDHPFPRCHLRVRSTALRRRDGQPNARSSDTLRLDLQLQMVCQDFDHPIFEQDRPIQGEAPRVPHEELFPGL